MKALLVALLFFAAHLHPEKAYQEQWCADHNGVAEHLLDDKTRVDCLTETHAVEVEFAPKWAEAVGQSLYYGYKTNRKPGIVLIIEKPEQSRYLKRLTPLADKYNIDLWIVNPSYLTTKN